MMTPRSVVHHKSVPNTPVEGDIYYNTLDSTNYIYQGDKWVALTFVSDSWDGINTERKKKIKNIYGL